MKPEQLRKLIRNIEHFGTSVELDKAKEECEELIEQIELAKQGTVLLEDIIDEIADVKVMLAQLEIIFDCSGAVEDRVEYKINRQMERIEKELS